MAMNSKANFINRYKQWKSNQPNCNELMKFIKKYGLSKNFTHFESLYDNGGEIIKQSSLSFNDFTTKRFILKHMDFLWNWKTLIFHRELFTFDEVKHFEEHTFKECLNYLQLTEEQFLTYKNVLDPTKYSYYGNVTFIFKYTDWLRNWAVFSHNYTLTSEIFLNNLDKPWDYRFVCNIPAIRPLVESRPDIPWIYRFCCYLSLDFIKLHKELDINYDWYIDRHFDYITSNNLPVSMSKLSELASLSYIKDHPEIQWDYNSMSYNKNITVEFFMANRDKPWNPIIMSILPIDAVFELKEYCFLDCDKYDFTRSILSNPYITISHIIKIPNICREPWHKHILAYNNYTLSGSVIRQTMADDIQRKRDLITGSNWLPDIEKIVIQYCSYQ